MRSDVRVVPGPPFYGCLKRRRRRSSPWLTRKSARRPFGLPMPSASHNELGSEVPRDGVSATQSPQARPRAAHFCASPAAPERHKRRGRSSVGRAVALQASGRRFDPVRLHHLLEWDAQDCAVAVWPLAAWLLVMKAFNPGIRKKFGDLRKRVVLCGSSLERQALTIEVV